MLASSNRGDERQRGSIHLETASGGDGPHVAAPGEQVERHSVGTPLLGRTRARAIEEFVARPVVFGSLLTLVSCATVGHAGATIVLDMPVIATVCLAIAFVVVVPYSLLVWLTLRVSMLRQLCVRPAAWYFWGAVGMRTVIAVLSRSANGPHRAANTILVNTAPAVLFTLLPMTDAAPPKLARISGRFACPVAALLHLCLYANAKLAEHPWTRNGNVWEWLVKDADRRTHEARLPHLRPRFV